MSRMEQIVLDTNIYDAAYEDRELWDLICKAREKKLVKIYAFNVQLDQIHAIDDVKDPGLVEKKAWLLYAVGAADTIRTYGSYQDLSRDGWSSPAAETEVIRFIEGKTPNAKHRADALIAATAFHNGFWFVTNEKHSLPSKFEKLGGRAMDSAELKACLAVILQESSVN